MRELRGWAVLGTVMLAACQAGPSYTDAPLDTENQQASYSLGLDAGGQFEMIRDHFDIEAFMRGVDDALNERDFAMTDDERMTVMQSFGERMQVVIAEAQAAEALANREAGEAYLAENGAREGVTTTASGLQYEVITAGEGPMPSATDNVSIYYTGTLIDGTEFDSTQEGAPATFNVGQVIAGFTEALMLMNVGSTYRVVIPSDLAYGEPGSGRGIGPNTTLIFEMQLLEIQPTGDR